MKATSHEFPAAEPGAWRAAAEESLKGAPFEKKLRTRTHEGITLQPIYTAAEMQAAGVAESWPGLAPFTRGAGAVPRQPLVAQEIPVGTPVEFNAAVLDDLMRGQNALALQLDVASRRCLDPSEAETSEVATCGLSLACLEDAQAAFRNIEVNAIDTFVWAGASALPVTGLLMAHTRAWRGGILGDPLTEYARDGALALALDDAYAEMAACAAWSAAGGACVRAVGVGSSLWADAGGSAVEELAFGLATAVEYLRELEQRGIAPAQAAGQFAFLHTLGSHVLIEIAKLRAARLLWARVLEAAGAPAAPAFLHARSTVFNKSWLDPHTNMLRASAEALVGVLGGVDSLHIAAFDEAARVPDAFSRRIARNVHAILAEECWFTATADPAGGSWAIETLTAELAGKAWALFQEVEKQGGMAAALRAGFPQQATAKVAAMRLEAAATRRDGWIGVNLFPNTSETPLEHNSPDAQALHAARAAAIEARRPHALPKISRSVDAVAAAFAAGATLGQIREALPRSAACEPAIERVRVRRAAEGFEALRATANRHAKAHGKPPSAWLANFGPPKQHKARADFSAGFLAAGGFQVLQGSGAASVADAAKAAADSKAPLVVLCSTDETYPEIVPAFIEALRAKRSKAQILLAGYPPDHVEAFRAAGIDGFIHLRANCLETLQQLHAAIAQ